MTTIQDKKSRIHSFEEIQNILNNRGYTIVKDTFVYASKKFVAIDNEGYLYYMNRDNVFGNKTPERFHRNNPYTIHNINNYIERNNVNVKLISTEYHNNSENLLWECGCGEKFERCWANFRNGAILCDNCWKIKSGKKRRTPLYGVYSKIGELGYILVDDISNICISEESFTIKDNDDYLYEVRWHDLKSNRRPHRFHRGNPYSIQNINLFFKKELNGEYECISDEYINNMSPLTFKHICGCVFDTPWAYMDRYKNSPLTAYCKCPDCNTRKVESHHASALKQVFLHEYPDTTVEEKSCINPNTLRIMPTDIVNDRLKVAIEVQSSFHDDDRHKITDKIKKDFWIEKGYSFYDPDIRDYTILEMIQIFFPDINKIPDYVDFNFSNCIDFNEVQKFLNDGYTIKEISNILNLNENTVRCLSTVGKVNLPDGYKEKIFNIRAIIRLSKTGEFIKKYDSFPALKEDNLANGTIRRVLKGKQSFSYDSFWLYEDDYLSGNYTLPAIKEDIFLSPVAKYDMSDNYICSYNTIYEAENDSNSSKTEIRRVASGERKSSRNEKWKFI